MAGIPRPAGSCGADTTSRAGRAWVRDLAGDSDAWTRGGGPTWRSGSYDSQLDLVYWGRAGQRCLHNLGCSDLTLTLRALRKRETRPSRPARRSSYFRAAQPARRSRHHHLARLLAPKMGHGASRFVQWPGCAGVLSIVPPRGMHWLGGSSAWFSTALTSRSNAC
jgi:hypothetical protein